MTRPKKHFKILRNDDLSCTQAYWGEAMSLLRQLVSRPEETDLKRGWELIQRAQAMGARTQWEHDYIDALAFFYRDYDKVDCEKRVEAYFRAMDGVYQQYPKD